MAIKYTLDPNFRTQAREIEFDFDDQIYEADFEVEIGSETSAQISEAWAVGQKDGVDVPETDPTYHNNSKYYAEVAAQTVADADAVAADRRAADAAKDAAEDAQQGAETAEDNAEAWAVGQKDGVDVPETDPTHQNNAKYYAGQAAGSATAAGQAKDDAQTAQQAAEDAQEGAETAEDNAEAWAVGQKDGADVPETDPTHQNNAKYYAGQAADSATAAGQAKDEAQTAQQAAEDAQTGAETAEDNAEAWAVGQKDGADVPDTDPTHQNNAKYYAGQAADSATAAGNAKTAAEAAQQAAEAAAINPPYIHPENKTWMVWDKDTKAYVDTGYAAQGPQGVIGPTPDIQIGTVTTLPEGSQATATMGGTPEEPVLNLGIPKGDTGSVENVYATSVPMSPTDDTTIKAALDQKKDKQDPVMDPTASGEALSFIDSISQDENGEITATKKAVQVDSALSDTSTNPIQNQAVQAGLTSLSHQIAKIIQQSVWTLEESDGDFILFWHGAEGECPFSTELVGTDYVLNFTYET